MEMDIRRISAFSDGLAGGNPAGVAVLDELPDAARMQRVAAEVGYSETVFAAPSGQTWRVRYFSPEAEVPFCGHATIALGAELAALKGDGVFDLMLNDARISVEGKRGNGQTAGLSWAALQSPATQSEAAPVQIVAQCLELFGYPESELDGRIPPAIASAGARHLIVALRSREALSRMHYEFADGQAFMRENGLVTIVLVHAESAQRFHTRNPFAFGGVYEDPATGAATAALAGYLRDIGWPHGGRIEVVQGEDMGKRSRLSAEIASAPGGSIRVSGTARVIDGPPH